jgi:aminoglycoside phosphotransferase (APT) family kinase protein
VNPDAARDYVSGSILPSMGITGRPFDVSPPPEGGTRSSLFLIRAEGMPPLLMRAFAHHGQAARTAEALRHLDEVGLPAPRLIYHDLARRARLLPGPGRAVPFITVETWIEGRRHAGLADPVEARRAALEVADTLASYHAVTRVTWGRPSAPVRGRFLSFTSYTLAGARRMAGGLASRGWLSQDEAVRVVERFDSWRESIAALAPHNLVHNDANRHNFVLTPEGRIVPVDLHRLAYEPFAEELINALYHFCRKDAVLASAFVEAYFRRAGDESRRVFESTRGFFEPLNYLKKMYQRAARPGGGAVDRDDSKMIRWRGNVLAMEGPP